MKIIALEEHFQIAEIKKAVAKYFPGQSASHLLGYNPPDAPLEDLGAGRLQRMDAMGIDVQVLSYTPAGLPAIPAAEAVPLAREINNRLAATIQTHPDRFAGFATLPTADPQAAAAELERAVQKLGLKGAMIGGRTNGLFLDDPLFQPILETAAALEVTIYLHPSYPPKAVQDACYAGLDPAVSARFATAGWGWHLETGTHALHMILSGVFDRYPGLQLILGHWGEMIPFYLDRFAEMLTQSPNTCNARSRSTSCSRCMSRPVGCLPCPVLAHHANYGGRSYHVFGRLSLCKKAGQDIFGAGTNQPYGQSKNRAWECRKGPQTVIK